MCDKKVIGVDVGGTKILAGVIDSTGGIQRRIEIDTPTSSTEELLDALDRVVAELLGPGILAIGFGLPSCIDQSSGMVLGTVNLPLVGIPFRGRMQERFQLPVGVVNDGNAAAIAEWKVGAGRHTSNLVMLTLGTGVGGGLILDGKPYRGSMGAGAELGHMVVLHDGPPCHGNCTGHGHLEALASGYAASLRAREWLGRDMDARELVDIARGGDKKARDCLSHIGEQLGSALGSLVNIFNPERIVIGGGFAAAGDLILEPARARMKKEALPDIGPLTEVVLAELGADAGLVGAGFIAFEALDDENQP